MAIRTEPPVILFCRCTRTTFLPPEARTVLEDALHDAGGEVWMADDLCGLAARRHPVLARVATARAGMVIACHERAVRALFHFAGVPLRPETAVCNLRTRSVADILPHLPAAAAGSAPPDELPDTGDWLPWFPVIDPDRCRDCGQCASFCLFGVYRAESGSRPEVVQPAGCKTHCPACARICPEAAIIFPKHPEPPIDGAAVANEAAVRAEARRSVEQLLGGDPYAALARRQHRARQLLRDQPSAPEVPS